MIKVILTTLLLSSFLYAQKLPLIFKGNKNFSDSELYKVASIEVPFFSSFLQNIPKISTEETQEVALIIKNYYKYKGFFHATTKASTLNDKVIIEILENEPLIIADMTINSKLDVASQIPFEVDDIFDSEKFTQSKKNIKIFYEDNSYCKIELFAKAWIDIETNNAYLTYDTKEYDKCTIDSISITSTKNIDTKIVKSLLYIRKGDDFSSKRIKDSYDSLYATGGIAKATINTHIDENSNKVSVTVEVQENDKPTRLETGLGFSTDEGAMVSLGIENKNIFGNLKTLGLNTRITQKKQNIQLNFNMPLSHRNSTGADGGYANDIFDGHKEERTFANIYLAHRKKPHRLTESIVFDNSNTYGSEDKILFPEGKTFITSPKIRWDYDTRDNILSPKKGHFLSAELMGSVESIVSEASYYKTKIKGGYILPLKQSILAFQATFGHLNIYEGAVPASYRFYAGGVNSNRAYTYNSLGPKNKQGDPAGFNTVFETTIEYRYPIYNNFKGVVFNDNTFIADSPVDNYNGGYYSLGVGIRYETPIGPLAFDVGFDVNDPQENYAFQFRIGEVF
ncbi:MAG TPA: hypothetical protein EYG93_00290 [Sulfurospirillum arcachonense]|nr:hypothetical protein [Sulfurospirillum arcachonense]